MDKKGIICLDTGFILDFLGNGRGAVAKAASIVDFSLMTTSIQVFEILLEVQEFKKNKEERLKVVGQFLSALEILPLNGIAADYAAQVLAEALAKGKSMSMRDAFVIGILRANGCERLISKDTHFDGVNGIKVESY